MESNKNLSKPKKPKAEMELINLNICFIRKQQGLTQEEFANKIGVKRHSLGSYEEGRASPSIETIKKIATLYNISIDDLVTKNLQEVAGLSMFNKSELDVLKTKSIAPPSKTLPSNLLDSEGKNLRILSITVGGDGKENIELVNEKAAAGYVTGYGDTEYIEELPKFRLPFMNLNNGTFRAFEIKGDSMLPLPSGSVVVGEYVENWSTIESGLTYIVVSTNGVVYKRVHNNIKEDNTLFMRSDNSVYPTYPIKIEDIKEVWKAKTFISKEMPSNEPTLEKLMSAVMELQQEVIRLKKYNN